MKSQVASEVSRTGGCLRALMFAALAGSLAQPALAGGRTSFSFSTWTSSGSCGSGYGYGFGHRPIYTPVYPVHRPVYRPVYRPIHQPIYQPVVACPPPVVVKPVCPEPVVYGTSFGTSYRTSYRTSVTTFVGDDRCDDVVVAPRRYDPHWRSWDSAPARTIVVSSPQPVVVSQPPVIVQQPPTVVQQAPIVVQQPAPVVIQQPAPIIEQTVFKGPVTVYQASGFTGTMDKGVSPNSIIAELRRLDGDARAQRAEDFLGRTLTEAWGVLFEGVQEVGGVREIRARGLETLSSGYKPTILVRGSGQSNVPPRRIQGQVTGRVVSISVDDPAYPGGIIVVDDAFVKW